MQHQSAQYSKWKCAVAWVLAIQFLALPFHQLALAEDPSACEAGYGELASAHPEKPKTPEPEKAKPEESGAKPYTGERGLKDFKRLNEKSFSAFFGRRVQKRLPNGHMIFLTEMDDAEKDAFRTDFTRYLAYKEKFGGQNLKAFRKWMREKFGGEVPIPDPFTMENRYKAAPFTLEHYSNELYSMFLNDTVKDPSQFAQSFERFVRIPGVARAVDFTKEKALWFLNFNKNLFKDSMRMIFVIGTIGSAWSIPLNPINQWVNVKANRLLGPVAKFIQRIINYDTDASGGDSKDLKDKAKELETEKKELSDLSAELKKKNSGAMSEKESKQLWGEFQTRFYELAQKMGQSLQADLGYGRDLFRQFLVQNPINYAAQIATFDTNLKVNQQAMAALDAKIAQEHRQPTTEEAAALANYKMTIGFARRGIGSVLAEWKVDQFFYREVFYKNDPQPQGPEQKRAEQSLEQHFNNLGDYMGFKDFNNEYADSLTTALQAMDEQISLINKLADKPKDAAPNPLSSVVPANHN